jgi:hypothetical protein
MKKIGDTGFLVRFGFVEETWTHQEERERNPKEKKKKN